jgi:hypothetical protein
LLLCKIEANPKGGDILTIIEALEAIEELEGHSEGFEDIDDMEEYWRNLFDYFTEGREKVDRDMGTAA